MIINNCRVRIKKNSEILKQICSILKVTIIPYNLF